LFASSVANPSIRGCLGSQIQFFDQGQPGLRFWYGQWETSVIFRCSLAGSPTSQTRPQLGPKGLLHRIFASSSPATTGWRCRVRTELGWRVAIDGASGSMLYQSPI
jgi:hypothetical protein